MSLCLKITVSALLLITPLASLALERTELLPQGETSVRITQSGPLRNDFNDAFGDRLRKDERIQDFTEAFAEKLKKKAADGKFTLETRTLFEILKLLKGEIAFVYNSAAKISILTMDRIYLAATASPEDYANVLKRTAWLHEQTSEQTVRKKETFNDVEIVCDIIRGGEPTQQTCWLAWVQGTVLLGSDREWIEKSIVRLQKEPVTEPPERKLSCRFPIGLWIRKSLEDAEDDKRAKSEALWNALGFMDIEQYQLGIEMKDGELILDGNLTCSELGQGLFLLLDTTPEDFSDNRLVPDNASSFSYGKLDLLTFWQALPEMLKSLPPDMGMPLSGVLMFFEKQSGLNIEQDLLAHAGRQFTWFSVPVSTNQPMLISVELNNSTAMENSLTTLLASPFAGTWSSAVAVSDFRGHTIYNKKEKTSDAEPFALCVTDSHLLFGSNAEVVRNTILQMERTGYQEPSTMQKTAEKLAPSTAFGYGAMDHRTAPAVMYIRVSDSTFSAGFGIQPDVGKPTDGKEPGENEISLDHLTSFLNNTYHFIEAVPNGIHHRIVFENNKNQGAH